MDIERHRKYDSLGKRSLCGTIEAIYGRRKKKKSVKSNGNQ